MNDNRGKKLVIVCICLSLSVVLLIISFTEKHASKKEKKNRETQTLETEDIEPELYQTKGEVITIYFTNTEQIDEKGVLPYKELEQLTEKTQAFLHSKGYEDTELPVIDGSLKKEGKITTFSCKLEKAVAVVDIGYDAETDEFDFSMRGEEK